MPKHIRPTKEELDLAAKKATEEAIELSKKDPEEKPDPETPEDENPPVVEDEGVEIEKKDKPEEETDEEKAAREKLEKEVAEKNKKLSASARENQKILAKNRVMNQALIEADEIPEPTEEELTKEYPEWADMTETEKRLSKESLVQKRWRSKISAAKETATKIEKWNESVDAFIDDPNTLISNPDLEGKTDAFKEFAGREENNSVPFSVLVPAFLYDHEKNKPVNQGSQFLRGKGGPKDKPVIGDGKMTIEEGKALRLANYEEWKKALAEGRIASDF